MRSIASMVMAVTVTVAVPGVSRADLVRYTHPHPIAPGVHKGMCHIEGPHLHAYPPHKPALYIKVKGHYAFIGDPVEFEQEAPKTLYYGHHPAFWVDDPEGEPEHYCYIAGPHYHWYAPPPRFKASFELKGGAHWYVAAHPKWYKARFRRYRPVARYYATATIERPVITVEPPEGFVGVVIGPGGHHRAHGHVHGGLYISPPHAGVHVAPPRVDVNIGLPGVGVIFGPGRAPPPGHRVKVRGGKHKVKFKGHGGRGKGKWKWK